MKESLPGQKARGANNLNADLQMVMKLNRHFFPIAFLFLAAPALAQTPAPDWSKPTPVTITMTSYAYAPAIMDFRHGVVYRLHLVNASGKDHNFSAPEFFAAAQVAPGDKGKIDDGAIDVDGGQSVDVELVPGTPGAYNVQCTHFMHAMLGMTAKAIVR
jgi:plastocyanin